MGTANTTEAATALANMFEAARRDINLYLRAVIVRMPTTGFYITHM